MRVVLYSKADCHQCDAFHFELSDLQSELGFVYEKRQLRPDDPLLIEWAGSFPVVEIETAETALPLRLVSPTTQRQLREQIRQSSRTLHSVRSG